MLMEEYHRKCSGDKKKRKDLVTSILFLVNIINVIEILKNFYASIIRLDEDESMSHRRCSATSAFDVFLAEEEKTNGCRTIGRFRSFLVVFGRLFLIHLSIYLSIRRRRRCCCSRSTD